MSNPSSTSFKMVLSPYARDRFNYERGATKTLISFLPYDEHTPEKVIIGLKLSQRDYPNYIELIIGTGKAVINSTAVLLKEQVVIPVEKPLGDTSYKVVLTSNKYEDLMGHVVVYIMPEQEFSDFKYKNLLLGTLEFKDNSCTIIENETCLVSVVDIDLAKSIGHSFRPNNVFINRSDLQMLSEEQSEHTIQYNGFKFKIPDDYEFNLTNDRFVYLAMTDEKIVLDGIIYEYGFVEGATNNYFEMNNEEITKMIEDKIHNIYLGTDGELWQIRYRLVYVNPSDTVDYGVLVARIIDSKIQNIVNEYELSNVKDDVSITTDTIDGNLINVYIEDGLSNLFSNYLNNFKINFEMISIAKNKTAVFVTDTMKSVHVDLSKNIDDFVEITEDNFNNTITEEFVKIPKFNLFLRLDKDELNCTYIDLFKKFIFINYEVKDVTLFNISTNPYSDVTPLITMYDNNGIMRSSVSINKLKSYMRMGNSAYALGCNNIITQS